MPFAIWFKGVQTRNFIGALDMNDELDIQEHKGEYYTIFHLCGELTTKTFSKVEFMLRSLLESAEPEFVLLKCSALQHVDPTVFETLREVAELFSEEARELAVCSIAKSLYMPDFFSPPLSYYGEEEDALKAFSESRPQKLVKPESSSDLLAVRKPVLKLIASSENKETTAYLRGQEQITIGRHSQCGLSLPHVIQISRFHCKCYEKDGKFYLEDMNSANGTLFQDAFIDEPVEIRDSDRFRIGNVWIEVQVLGDEKGEEALPDLDIPETQFPEQIAQMEFPVAEGPGDVLQTKFGIKFSDLLAEQEETVLMSVDKTRLASLYSEYVLQQPKASGLGEQLRQTKAFPFAVPSEKAVVPGHIARKSMPVSPGDLIAKQYRVLEKRGESNTCFLLLCEDTNSKKSVFLQYAKEPMFLHHIGQRHPHLMSPAVEDEWQGRWYRVFLDAGQPLSAPPIAEIGVVEIGMALSDMLISLHKVGRNGCDIAPSHVFRGQEGVPKFAVIPAVIYNDVLGEKADVFALGALLLDLATGIQPPATAIGTVENDKIIQALEQHSITPALGQLVLDILNFHDQNLETIAKRLHGILLQMLAPSSSGDKAILLHLIKVADTGICHCSGKMKKFDWPQDLASQVTSDFSSPLQEEKLVEIGRRLYQCFPSQISASLAETRHLSLILGEELAALPWEIAHDNKEFLALRYCVARDLMDMENSGTPKIPLVSPRVFILADIAPWAQEIKELLLQTFQQFPNVEVSACNTNEKPITICQNMYHSDIFHIIGSTDSQGPDPMDSGWVLSPRKNLFKIRILAYSPRKPRLVFYQGKTKAILDTHNFVMSLYKIGIKSAVGTLWSVKKTDLALVFYRNLFRGMPIGEAVLRTRKEFSGNPHLALSLFLYGPSTTPIVGI